MAATTVPSTGQIVRLRSRTWLVEQVVDEKVSGSTTVSLACIDDDAQGEQLTVNWDIELDRRILSDEAWKEIGKHGFDPPRQFAAFLNTLRWNCVTATDPGLFQSPFRAGIKLDPYQLEPLAKALALPRVNLFIADDVGLGKTIEAGLIASEMLLRKRITDIVVACPPAMLLQWKEEMESRFGLIFEIFDRDYLERIRRERGHTVNAWETFPRFLISHKLLISENYAGPMRQWLGNLRPGSLFIFDEAHHAAPASSSHYAIESQTTQAIRSLSGRFEHRLFLSATPHNGHSNSFSALLAILDGDRFIPGVPVDAKNRDEVLVRRLKEDLRQIGVPGFPERIVEQIDLPGDVNVEAPSETIPELQLAKLLENYRSLRLERSLDGAKAKVRGGFELLICRLQKRLLSSVEAFARSLAVHRKTMDQVWAQEITPPSREARGDQQDLLPVDANDDRATLGEEELEALFDDATERATLAAAGDASLVTAEKAVLDEMHNLAEKARGEADLKIRWLVQWIADNQCAGVRLPEDGTDPEEGAPWGDRRLIIFTEWDATKRYIEQKLKSAICETADWEERIEIFHGPTPADKRDALKHAFNAPPEKTPLRILICTDAAREGLNLQAQCQDLLHFDIPWNPARMEQRNGRIDRKLQPASEVYCRYFFYTDRPEDRVLRAIARKTRVIEDELGSMTDVVEKRLRKGIRRAKVAAEVEAIEKGDDPEREAMRKKELESARRRKADLKKDVDRLGRRLDASRKAIGFNPPLLRDAISCSLELLEAEGLQPTEDGRFQLPDLEARRGADPTWTTTLDTLRAAPEKGGPRDAEWRRNSPIRPVTFKAPEGIDDSVVQLHLSHRLVQRLLGRFTAQGFLYDDLSRACLATSDDPIPRVVLLGRLAIYGPRAARLHEELITVTARWSPPDLREKPLVPFGSDGEKTTLQLLFENLAPGKQNELPKKILAQLSESIPFDVEQLHAHLQPRGEEAMAAAVERLKARGDSESTALRDLLEKQKATVSKLFADKEALERSELTLNDDEQRQRRKDISKWKEWLDGVDETIANEAPRIRDFYVARSHRIEPVGLVYLWPTNE